MAKSLGQIHTANLEINLLAPVSPGDKWMLDASQILTEQLQKRVRQGNFFKTVGIDMSLHYGGINTHGGEVSGKITYYAPTKGRCAAYRDGFKAMASVMNQQGIKMRDNAQYDFRVLQYGTTYQNINDIVNLATFDGVNTLSLGGSGNTSLFDVYNDSQRPAKMSGTPTFSSGYGVYGSTDDFVLNEGIWWSGNENVAEDVYESIPFSVSWTPGSDTAPLNFNWRPDLALYLAVMCGQFVIEIDAIDYDGGATQLDLSVAVHIAGWKSIMGDPDKKKNRRRKG